MLDKTRFRLPLHGEMRRSRFPTSFSLPSPLLQNPLPISTRLSSLYPPLSTTESSAFPLAIGVLTDLLPFPTLASTLVLPSLMVSTRPRCSARLPRPTLPIPHLLRPDPFAMAIVEGAASLSAGAYVMVVPLPS